jgi:nucleotide-binding universal stress UspA family protein
MKSLLAIDEAQFAEVAIQSAISQIRRDHTQVLVLDWSNFMPSPFPGAGERSIYSLRQLDSIIQSETMKAHELVNTAAERLRSAGFEASTSVRQGTPKQ